MDRKLTKKPVISAEDLRENLKQSFDGFTVEYCRKLFYFDNISNQACLTYEQLFLYYLTYD